MKVASRVLKSPMIAVLSFQPYRLLWLGQCSSLLGDFVNQVGIMVLVFGMTGSGMAIGVLFLIDTLASLLAAPLAGVMVDRYDRRRIMVSCDLIRAGAAAVLAVFPSMVTAYLASAVVSTASVFFNPARQSIVPKTVPNESLMAANSMSALTSSVARVAGAALGAGLVGALGAPAAFSFNSASFVISAVCVSLMRLGPPGAETAIATSAAEDAPSRAETPIERRRQRAGRPGIWGEMREGLSFVWRDPRLTSFLVLAFGSVLGLGASNVLVAPLVEESLGTSTSSLGWLMSAEGFGTALGVIALGSLIKPAWSGRAALGASSVFALSMAGLGLCASLWQAGGLFLVAGVALVVFNVSAETLFQSLTTDEVRGRVFGIVAMVMAAGNILSAVVGGVLVDLVGVRLSFETLAVVIGAGCVLFFMYSLRADAKTKPGRVCDHAEGGR